MRVNAYLYFDGRCEAAFAFYAERLGGRIVMMTKFGDTPMAAHMPPEWSDKIVHARMELGDGVLMGSDPPPDSYEAPKGFSVSLGVGDVAEAERVFHALAEGGDVRMPIQKTFWAARFGMLVDKFGVPWMVNCDEAG